MGCGRSQTSSAGSPASSTPPSSSSARAAAPEPRSEQLEAMWTRAKEAREDEPDELARLAHKEGAAGLVERGADPAWRETAIRAMAYADGWDGLPWLADIASGCEGATDKDATLAVESASALAARPRRAVDPEDAAELHAGCTRLASLAGDAKKPKAVADGAARALRMLADYGCSLDGRDGGS